MLRRLAVDADRRASTGDHHAVGPGRLPRLDGQPPPLAVHLQPDNLGGDDFSPRLFRDLAQVGTPLPVGGPQAAAVHPVGVGAPYDQVPLPAVVRHRRGDRGRGRPPAVGVREADVLLRRRPQRQEAARVSLQPTPTPGDGASVDQDDARRIEAAGRQGTRLGGDSNPLRPGAYDRQCRHQARG